MQRSAPIGDKAPYIVLMMLLAAVGVAAVVYATYWGAGLSPDSVAYIDAARHLLHGQGLTVTASGGATEPFVVHASLFPAVLAAIGLFGIDPLDTARWLNAFLFGANIVLIGLAIRRYTRSLWVFLFGLLVVVTSVDLYTIHSTVFTEPLYLFCALGGLLLLDSYLIQHRPAWLILSALMVAPAVLTRYAGGALIATGAFALLRDRTSWRQRCRQTLLFLIGAVLPLLVWLTRNRLAKGTLTGRTVLFHPPTLEQYQVAVNTFAHWFVPARLAFHRSSLIALIGAVFLVTLFGGAAILRRERNRIAAVSADGTRFPYVFLVHIIAYLGFLLLSQSWFDAYNMWDERILLPIFMSGLVVVLHPVETVWRAMERVRHVKIFAVVICLAFLASYALSSSVWVWNSHRVGRGYASKTWQQSELIASIRRLPTDALVYSNAQDAILLLTGRSTYGLPVKEDPMTRLTNGNYLAQLARIGERLRSENGGLAYFNTITWRYYLPTEDELRREMRLRLIQKTGDGALYVTEP